MKKILKKKLSLIMAVVVAASIFGGMTELSLTSTVAASGYTIKVNLGTNTTTIYKNGKAIKAMICSPSSETPTGTFYIPEKYRWHEMIGNCYAQYCSRITTGVLFHSVWCYTNGDASTMSVAAYNVMGQKASHGCVRLLCKDAKWIYDNCPIGTKIVIFWGDSSDDPLERPTFTPITNGRYTDYDPTDPASDNPYKTAKPVITRKVKTIQYGSKVKLKNLINLGDTEGNTIDVSLAKIKTKGKINTNKLGTYKIKYTVKLQYGKKATKTLTFKVVDKSKPSISGLKKKKKAALGKEINLLSGVSAKTATGTDLTSKIKVTVVKKKTGKKVTVKKGKVTFPSKGKYKVKYKVTGTNKKTAVKTVTYNVVDKRLKMTLTCKTVTLEQGDDFNALSYVKSVKSSTGKKLSKKKYVTYNTVDTSTPGTYTVTYTAQKSGKSYTARTKTLTVIVKASASDSTETETTTAQETTSDSEETTVYAEEVTTAVKETTVVIEEETAE